MSSDRLASVHPLHDVVNPRRPRLRRLNYALSDAAVVLLSATATACLLLAALLTLRLLAAR